MFNIKEFEKIYNLLKENNKKDANNNLISYRSKYALHPDYLFLMAEYLTLEDRIYQAIDTLHASLLVDCDDIFLLRNNFEKSSNKLVDKKFELFNKLFKKIDNLELLKQSMNANSDGKRQIFFKKIQELMPGIGFNKKS
tara:strand:+ start:900 stop:1316 length:417 start_codon:yes stop_codon:yes gene_type:complete